MPALSGLRTGFFSRLEVKVADEYVKILDLPSSGQVGEKGERGPQGVRGIQGGRGIRGQSIRGPPGADSSVRAAS